MAVDPDNTNAADFHKRAGDHMGESVPLADLQADEETWAKYREALVKFRAGDLAAAEELWRDILILYPGHSSVLSNLEQIRRRRGDEPVASSAAVP